MSLSRYQVILTYFDNIWSKVGGLFCQLFPVFMFDLWINDLFFTIVMFCKKNRFLCLPVECVNSKIKKVWFVNFRKSYKVHNKIPFPICELQSKNSSERWIKHHCLVASVKDTKNEVCCNYVLEKMS